MWGRAKERGYKGSQNARDYESSSCSSVTSITFTVFISRNNGGMNTISTQCRFFACSKHDSTTLFTCILPHMQKAQFIFSSLPPLIFLCFFHHWLYMSCNFTAFLFPSKGKVKLFFDNYIYFFPWFSLLVIVSAPPFIYHLYVNKLIVLLHTYTCVSVCTYKASKCSFYRHENQIHFKNLHQCKKVYQHKIFAPNDNTS